MIIGILLLIITAFISITLCFLTDYKEEIWTDLLKKGGKHE